MKRVLVANRGEIAVRVIRACRGRGIEVVAVCSEADRDALHVRLADAAVELGPAAATESYLRVDAVLEAAHATGADAVHPGYGFLSENAGFARRVVEAGLTWIGPPVEAIEAMGSKIGARERMVEAGVPVVPGVHDAGQDVAALVAAAEAVGYPLLVKASAGGGGKGMRAVHAPEDLEEAIRGARREAASAFADADVYLERLLVEPRHVEIQIFGDSAGNVVHLMERECSIQRRHQKVVEECPSPALGPEVRAAMGAAAVAAAKAVGYVGAGTVEFMLDADGGFYFLEMNTRLQVEHPVTEAVLGVDLVDAQLEVADGGALPWTQAELGPRGAAIEVRLYAEDPARGFLPATGRMVRWRPPVGPGVRVDSGLVEGDEVTPWYDPMLAKLIVWGPTRAAAIGRLRAALADWEVHGVVTNLGFLQEIVGHEAFVRGDTHTGFIGEHFPEAALAAGSPPSRDALIACALEPVVPGPRGAGLAAGGASEGRAGASDAFSPWSGLGPWRTVAG